MTKARISLTLHRVDELDDNNLFKSAMSGVKPIDQDHHKPHHDVKKPPKRRAQNEIDRPIQSTWIDYDMIDQTGWVDGQTICTFKRSGISERRLKMVKTTPILQQHTLDLHRLTGAEALEITSQFITRALENGITLIQLVHGKGHFSQADKPILKNLLLMDLRKNSSVLAYHSALPRNGGTGALNVLLKGKR